MINVGCSYLSVRCIFTRKNTPGTHGFSPPRESGGTGLKPGGGVVQNG